MAERKAALKTKSFESSGRFLKDVKVELSKVIWPGKEEVAASTVVVLVAVAFFAIFIGIIDLAVATVIKLI